MATDEHYARLHVLLARRSRVGVVIRRGPSKQVCTFLWDLKADTFELGQWLKGRIYERRSDLSPDGRHLIYFAMNGIWESESKGSWTAISRAPYLKAIAMFPKGDCWYGGGLWTGNRTYWLNGAGGHTFTRSTSAVRRDENYVPETGYGGECPGVYYPRLLRDGWCVVDENEVGKHHHVTTFERAAPAGWLLRKISHSQLGAPAGKGCYWDEHQLLHVRSEQKIDGRDWEWADVVGKRVVWAARGKLFAGRLRAAGLKESKELFDFNGTKFKAVKAPY